MIRKFFPLDKNYLLAQAQLELQDELLHGLIDFAKSLYELKHNPLGLNDDMHCAISDHRPFNFKPLHGFYHNLAGIYRYKYGHNQLEFLWDGADHYEKYLGDWRKSFMEWTAEFCRQDQFLLAVMDLSVFLPQNRKAHLAENRMNAFITQYFELKIHKDRGIIEMKVA